ncbi:MAG TPA: FtsX-like permease family protein [Acetobacteraceae bacterium]|nr:FtsX-like permease family protein [Acetobacteraceae bacterium]
MTALTLARRLLRGGAQGLGIVVVCLALGVAAIASVGSLRAAVSASLAANGRAMLGGDLDVQTGAELPPSELIAWLKARGARVSVVTRMRSLLAAPSGARTLIDLQAVDANWPLVSAPVLDPKLPVAAALGRQPGGRYGIVVDRVVLARLGLKPGAAARIGTETFQVTAALVSAPDRASGPALFGAPALIEAAALPRAGIDVPGAFVSHDVRAAWADPAAAAGQIAALRRAFADRGWRVRGPAEAAPGIARFVDQTALFLTLIGLTSLLVGGVGAASGVRAWLDARMEALATLRCLGASSRLVFAVSAIQVGVLAAIGIAAGLAVGAAAPALARHWLGTLLPVPPEAALYAGPLGLAALYGVLTCAAFALPTLARALRIPGAALFRDRLIQQAARPPAAIMTATAVLGLALAGLAVAAAPDPLFALGFCGAVPAALGVFRLGAALLVWGLGRLPEPRFAPARIGLAALRAPGAATPLLLTSVGLGLATLAAVVLIEGNISRQVTEEMPANAPSLYFVDLQPDQLARFDAIVRATQGVEATEQMPSLRARIVSVNGVAAEQVKATPETRWALRGDRGLTYAATPPPGTQLVAGRWWPPGYDGPPLVSFDEGLARGWGIGIGAVIRLNVLGRDIDLKVANLRRIAWRRLGLNFVFVASPGLLSAAPHTAIATVRLPEREEGALLRRVADALPNVTAISVTEILRQVGEILGQLAAALAATASMTLAAGVLVLVGAVAGERRRRIAEAVVLRALGATRAQLRLAWLWEFGALGLVAGVLAALVGLAASWVVMRFVLNAPWSPAPGRLAGTVAGALALMLVFGYSGTAAALRAKPAARLRND